MTCIQVKYDEDNGQIEIPGAAEVEDWWHVLDHLVSATRVGPVKGWSKGDVTFAHLYRCVSNLGEVVHFLVGDCSGCGEPVEDHNRSGDCPVPDQR